MLSRRKKVNEKDILYLSIDPDCNYTFYSYPRKSYFDNNRVKTMAYRPFTNKDSFNPYGANSFESAIILGLINSLSEL